ncbi:Hypothetical predicted protein [Pelobates cultripes]|uniref:Uncharacterized protein n=1 Tax=Pelobates cultripes TaxID=61616 RepID=A0AAD1VNS7_PELCU|nr:Hypothetical predicted protein [Pelobates cultripes]
MRLDNIADTSAVSAHEYTQGLVFQRSGDQSNYVTQYFLVAKLDAQLTSINKQITNSFIAIKTELADLSMKVTCVEEKITKMDEQLTTLQGADNNIDNKVYQINLKLRDLEDHAKRCNLRFRNVPEDITQDQRKDFLLSYFQELSVSIEDQHPILERTHRLMKPKGVPSPQPRDVIA